MQQGDCNANGTLVKASYVPGVPKQVSVYMLNYLLVNGPFLWGHPVSVKKIFFILKNHIAFTRITL